MADYFTRTFTCALVQQHWNPWPPSPDQSLATTRSTYSPGSLKVDVVAALPLKAAAGCQGASATGGRGLANLTSPGPRNLLHRTVTGGVFGGLAPASVLASSATHSVSGSGLASVASSSVGMARGPCTDGPASAKASVGGVLPMPS